MFLGYDAKPRSIPCRGLRRVPALNLNQDDLKQIAALRARRRLTVVFPNRKHVHHSPRFAAVRPCKRKQMPAWKRRGCDRLAADARIFRKERGLFHPKVFLFATGDRYALFAGSSNLTYSGFYRNCEVNVLTEGRSSADDAADIIALTKLLEEWRSEDLSFKPTAEWLQQYRKDYQRNLAKQRENWISTEVLNEEEKIGGANWLSVADWKTYYGEVLSGLARHGREPESLHRVLDATLSSLAQPW